LPIKGATVLLGGGHRRASWLRRDASDSLGPARGELHMALSGNLDDTGRREDAHAEFPRLDLSHDVVRPSRTTSGCWQHARRIRRRVCRRRCSADRRQRLVLEARRGTSGADMTIYRHRGGCVFSPDRSRGWARCPTRRAKRGRQITINSPGNSRSAADLACW